MLADIAGVISWISKSQCVEHRVAIIKYLQLSLNFFALGNRRVLRITSSVNANCTAAPCFRPEQAQDCRRADVYFATEQSLAIGKHDDTATNVDRELILLGHELRCLDKDSDCGVLRHNLGLAGRRLCL